MINNTDYSNKVNELKVEVKHNYNSQTNAAGDSVIDYINSKRVIEVGFIPMTDANMKALLSTATFQSTITFLNPLTNQMETINCIVPDTSVEYYTIQVGNVLYKAFSLDFIEL